MCRDFRRTIQEAVAYPSNELRDEADMIEGLSPMWATARLYGNSDVQLDAMVVRWSASMAQSYRLRADIVDYLNSRMEGK